MIRVLLDQGLSPRAAVILRDHGWDAVHVSEIKMQTADDVDILNVARNTDRICITLDHDFHAHLALTRSGLPLLCCCGSRVSTELVRRHLSASCMTRVETRYRQALPFQLTEARF